MSIRRGMHLTLIIKSRTKLIQRQGVKIRQEVVGRRIRRRRSNGPATGPTPSAVVDRSVVPRTILSALRHLPSLCGRRAHLQPDLVREGEFVADLVGPGRVRCERGQLEFIHVLEVQTQNARGEENILVENMRHLPSGRDKRPDGCDSSCSICWNERMWEGRV